ncbi:MAG: ABC transporter substrate-binding protein [Azoarcus sp.]|jgi:ABC-type branched-subunit amino acid transport system substrate-binding protein|nr:ABC transporter substrate-binding protein [Azoarcus sp.]MDD2874400.1 ABC transporter substrate-binding protein [Azoarcus sp.]MDX9836727.1 ABC transporter substrate-binding protein [Azoarcus sp.]
MKVIRPLLAAAFVALVPLLPVTAAHAQQGVSNESITLGQSGALTGPLAELSKEYLSGAMLHFNQLNAHGGVNGRKIELITEDDAYNPDRAAENVHKLIEKDHVLALFACFGTGPSLKAIPVATAAKVPFFAPYTGADAVRTPSNPLVFHLRASYSQEIEKMVDHLANIGVKSIAVVHHSDPFGQAGLDAATAALTRHGLPAPIVAPIASDGSNAAETVSKVVAGNTAAVILVTAGNSSPAFMRALLKTDYRPMLFGLSVISSRQLIRELGEKARGMVIAQVMPSPFRIDYPMVREYRQAADKAGQSYSYAALEGYLAARSFSEGLRRAGRELNRERLISALESLGDWDAGGLHLAFSPRNRSGLNFVDLTVIGRGSFGN